MKKKVGILSFVAVILLGISAWAESNIIPSGTKLTVRTNETIDSKTAQAGQTFSAVIDKNVTDSSGAILVPKGSGAELVIRKASSGGTVGTSELVLDLQSITVNGRRYMISTPESVRKSEREGIGKNRRTAEMVGGGAVLGTIIGAVAGGKKGAVLGAITGAAAGGAVQVLTRGKEVRVPAETVLTFRLNEQLKLV